MNQIKKILIVCTGNSCRSAIAEGILKDLLRGRAGFEISSAGTNTYPGMRPTNEAVEVMLESGIDISEHRARRLTPELIEDAGIILAMTAYHREYIIRLSHNTEKTKGKTFLLSHFDKDPKSRDEDIEDPLGEPVSFYRMCKNRIRELLENFVRQI